MCSLRGTNWLFWKCVNFFLLFDGVQASCNQSHLATLQRHLCLCCEHYHLLGETTGFLDQGLNLEGSRTVCRWDIWVQSKVQLTLEHALKADEGVLRYSSILSFNFDSRCGGQRHTPAALLTGMTPDTRCTGGWMGPRVCVDGFGKCRSYRGPTPGLSVP